MILHENRLLADDSHVLLKMGKVSQNLSSAAVVIGILRVKSVHFKNRRFKYFLYNAQDLV